MAEYATLINRLKQNGFKAIYFDEAEEASAYVASCLHGETVGFGGSQTSKELGLYEMLAKDNTVHWHWKEPDALQRYPEFTAYITSANAVAETGELVNIDGVGNRVSATLYGPKKVFFIVGVNKITPDLPSAIERARKVAAPARAKSLNKETPCTKLGYCVDCKHPQRICRGMVVHMAPMMGSEHYVVVVGKNLGF